MVESDSVTTSGSRSESGAVAEDGQRNENAEGDLAVKALRTGYTLPSACHNALEAVDAATDSFRRPVWSESQQQALKAWHIWKADWQGPEAGPEPMQAAIDILGNIFLGKLSPVSFEWRTDLRSPQGKPRYGQCSPSDSGVSRAATIVLDPGDHSIAKGVDCHHTALISTLLHECCHAFVHLYGYTSLCGEWICIASEGTWIGATGHGRAWFRLVTQVQMSARRCLDIDVRLNIFSGLLLEQSKSGVLPFPGDWERILSRCTFDEAESLLGSGREQAYQRYEDLLRRQCRYSELQQVLESAKKRLVLDAYWPHT